MRFTGILTFCSLLAAAPAAGNDGYAGLGAGGLEFGQSENIQLLTEDLVLSRSQVRVDYAFLNAGTLDEQVIVAFQLPPIAPGDQAGEWALPEAVRDAGPLNYLDFTATVDGEAVALESELRFFLPNPREPLLWGLAALEDPGPEVTDRLRALAVPETYDLAAILDWYRALPPKQRKTLLAEGIFGPDGMGETLPRYLVSQRYWWRQDFPAGALVRIGHSYTPVLGGSVYHLDEALVADFCIDAGTRRAIEKLAARAEASGGKAFVMLRDLQYVLRTAGTWSGPIRVFRLTLDKEDPNDLVSLCLDGIRKTGPTTFVMEQGDYRPAGDLRILFVDLQPVE